MDVTVTINDDEMEMNGTEVGQNIYLYNDKKYRLVRTDNIKPVSYYVEVFLK